MRLRPTRAYQQAVGLGEGRRLALLGKLSNDFLWHQGEAVGRWAFLCALALVYQVETTINPTR